MVLRELTPRELPPGCFAFVMATGIVAVGAYQSGLETQAGVLLVIAALTWVVLAAMTVWRILRHRDRVLQDLRDPTRAFGFFTFVAGTNVVGSSIAALGRPVPALVLLIVATLGWLVLGYVVPWSAVLGRQERPVLATANGTWFIWVVASESVAVCAASVEPHMPQYTHGLAIVAVLAWSVGLVLYAACAVFVSLRLLLYPLEPNELNPPYWVSMGAIAITVVAGARIVEMHSAPIVDATRELIAGMAVVLWSFATWLVPVLVAVGIWRHWVHRIPLTYEAGLWSIVFPFGMYAVAGMYLGQADGLPLTSFVGRSWFWVALAVWSIVFVAMVTSMVRGRAVSISRP
ncbi:tellurite resistance/C4-dicarboxylate transporter family protein [Mobilicoccus massiliensis]|uniref:tellurite resistance/C4-dicarboxylate transporter family protein n=1 Tax=Mobilicoccus massiliensis TaxID=1522310 RepID=UPI000A5CE007|nr:tellurite resistance/C4-dicarboxylate transporter family protein [Mobilicoccus massiliensis]